MILFLLGLLVGAVAGAIGMFAALYWYIGSST